MIKKIIGFFVLLPFLTSAQVSENDWINYNQSYFKFPIYSDGIYKITYKDLINAGINVVTISPKNLQIFYKGQEQHIFIQGENDGKFDVSDFIEFYAEKNDGAYDAKLYRNPKFNGDPTYSLFTDTSYYFLTWNNSTSNKRLAIESDVNFSSHTPAPYFLSKVNAPLNEVFQGGQLTFFSWPVPEFSEGTGWGTTNISYNQARYMNPSTPYVYKSGPNSKITTRIVGRSVGRHDFRISVNKETVKDSSNLNNGLTIISQSFSSNWLKDENELVFKSLNTSNNDKDKIAIMHYEITYPRLFNMGFEDKFLFSAVSGTEAKDLLVFSNFNNRNAPVWLYDLSNHTKIVVQPSNGTYTALVPNYGKDRDCYLASEAVFKSIDKISPVSGSSSFFKDYKSIAEQKGGISYFIVSHPSLLNAAEEYASYRTLNGKNALVFDIEQLYDQYAYGIKKHPMAIRNLLLEASNEWNTKPQNLFLIGKSITVKDSREGLSFKSNLVPTWGVLGSDIGFSNLIPGVTVLSPLIATGRIAANTETQVRDYLEKVKSYESAEGAEWMKNVLHFGGGSSATEQQTFANFLSDYENIAKSPSFGASVHTFLKVSSDPLQINMSDSVKTLINNGVSLMTFFGHAYSGNFDQSIDEPENYANAGKYGIILANSCLIGNIHSPRTDSGSERFVLAKNKGSIGFIGSSSLGVPSYLHKYTKSLYDNLCDKNYGKSIGEIVKQTIFEVQDSTNSLNRDVCMHMTLHGDPAIVINSHLKPDYTLYGDKGSSQAKVYFNPSEVSNEVDSFSVNVVVTNIGKAQRDTFDVLITRIFPNNSDTTYAFTLADVFYNDTLRFMVPIDLDKGIGLNYFDVSVDPLDQVDELRNDNNTARVSLLIKSSDITPVYPYEYSIVPGKYNSLYASTGDVYAPLKKYLFQIDTTDLFNSVHSVMDTVESVGGVVVWDLFSSPRLKSFYDKFAANTSLQNPNVYFWRVSPLLASGEKIWKSTSFQYVSDKYGWGQAHFHQFKKNSFQFLNYNYGLRAINFIEQTKTLSITSHSSAYLPYRVQTGYRIDKAIVCQNSTMWADLLLIAVIDKTTLKPWHTLEHGDKGQINYYGGKIAKEWNEYNYYFSSSTASHIDSIISFLKSVPDSNYILMYNFLSHNLPSWYSQSSGSGFELKKIMKKLGANTDIMMSYSGGSPYVFFTQKGDSSKTREAFLSGSKAELVVPIRNNWLDGSQTSTVIGEAYSFKSFHWEINSTESGNNLDTNRLSLFGIDKNGSKEKLLNTLEMKGDLYDLSSLSSKALNTMKTELYLNDNVFRTPNKLKRWQVVHDEIPEAALNPVRLTNYRIKDTLQQGELLQFVTAIENISNVDMDSMQVSYWFLDNKLNIKPKKFKQLKPLKAHEIIYDTIFVETASLQELNTLWYEINPYDGEKPWQLEKHHFNNIYSNSFQVNRDVKNPILDVAFDGIHILDGDIVSPNPNIVLTLDDENQYLVLDDKSLIQVFLNYPSAKGDSLILLDPSKYNFIPATLPKNEAKIEFQGHFPKDGTYDLRVMAKDKSKNISGRGTGVYDYKISFKVVNESSITQLINWPNPFSTSTQFVFVLTGSKIPDQISIQIMTITGKVVREINKDEIGSINIGRNITDFKWDGTDQYGDKLANGVYLYRVIVKSEGLDIKEKNVIISDDQNSTTLKDKYFQKGFGKMYILR